jgi:hypothetical protein
VLTLSKASKMEPVALIDYRLLPMERVSFVIR